MPKSVKQQWVAERLFAHAGSLTGMTTRLRQIASAPSTLDAEAKLLYDAIYCIQQVDLKKNQDLSWAKFNLIRGY